MTLEKIWEQWLRQRERTIRLRHRDSSGTDYFLVWITPDIVDELSGVAQARFDRKFTDAEQRFLEAHLRDRSGVILQRSGNGVNFSAEYHASHRETRSRWFAIIKPRVPVTSEMIQRFEMMCEMTDRHPNEPVRTLETDEDFQWLQDVHLPGLYALTNSWPEIAYLYGNEDAPSEIWVYHENDSHATPMIFKLDANGKFHQVKQSMAGPSNESLLRLLDRICEALKPGRVYTVYRYQYREMPKPKWGVKRGELDQVRDTLPPTVMAKPGILQITAQNGREALKIAKQQFAERGA